jgi:branched-chain amino acid transport system substrate-binding protein
MSEDWLRRRLDELSGDVPPSASGRVPAVLARARRRQRDRAVGVAVLAAAVLLVGTTAVTGGGGSLSLVADDPTPSAEPVPSPSGTAAPEPSTSQAAGTASPAADRSAGPTAPAPGPQPSDGPATAPADTSVLRLGYVAPLSGAAVTVAGQEDGVRARRVLEAWAADVNARGGLGGRPVELLVRDDRGDTGGQRQATAELVEAGVVAFVGSHLGSADSDGGAPVRAKAGTPVVGGDLASVSWRRDPLLFAQGAHPYEQGEGMLAVLGERAVGDDRDAAVVCIDGSACAELKARVEDDERAEAYGLRGTLVVRVGITETNYGPVVQRLKQAGIDLVALQMQPQQAASMGQEFVRQSYRPRAVVVQHDLTDRLHEQGRDAVDGWWAVQPVFPHVAADEVTERFRRVAPTRGSAEARAWAAAALLERAVATLGGERVTRERLVGALRELRGERLGGLVPPLALASRPTATCVLVARLVDAQWTAPQGLRPTCLAP